MTTGNPDSIPLSALHELWVHTGTACNLSCPFCHEGSKPGDQRLQAPTLAELAPLLDEAAARGVGRFAFTGGEPLILKGIFEILLHALQLRPVLVLTNGTAPFIRRAHQLAQLRTAPHALSLRVSIDYPDEARHDANRGFKNFRKALEGLRLLHGAGFATGITRQITPGENPGAVTHNFRQLLRRHWLPEDLPVVALPDVGALGLPTAAVTLPASQVPQQHTTCSRSRTLLKHGGTLQFHACPLTDDAARFTTGGTLEAALATRVMPDHPRCQRCFSPGVDYAGVSLQSETFNAR
ncbi:MAG: radical SAM protein [Steroidobacteraceae bacterium]